MALGELRVTFKQEDGCCDDDIELYVSAWSNGFSGQGCAYLSKSGLKADFQKWLDYPLMEGNILVIKSGTLGKDGRFKEEFSMSVKPVGSRGYVLLSILLKGDHFSNELTKNYESYLDFQMSYSDLERFVRELISMLNDEVNEVMFKESV